MPYTFGLNSQDDLYITTEYFSKNNKNDEYIFTSHISKKIRNILSLRFDLFNFKLNVEQSNLLQQYILNITKM